MSNDRYNPRRLEDDDTSLINEPTGPIADDVVVLGCVRREPPLRAVMLNALAHTQVLLGHLERGVPVSTHRQRRVVCQALRAQPGAATGVISGGGFADC
jgi:hypothetical protein